MLVQCGEDSVFAFNLMCGGGDELAGGLFAEDEALAAASSRGSKSVIE